LGLGLFFLGRFLNPKQLSAYQWPIFIFSILLLISPLVIGNFIRGSRRWLSLGPINLQPSEITKPLLMIFIATSSQPLFHLAAVLLIALEPDLGSALSVLILLTPVILTNRRILKISLLILIIGLVLSPFIWQHVLKDYQRQRLTTFINPQTNPLDGGYHVIQSKIAIGSGGFWGKGYKKGTQGQLLFLPEKHTDFIFAATAEELGLAAVILILIAYFLLSSSLLNHAYSLSDNRPLFIFNLGIFFLIWFQFFVNIGMNLGIMPVTGIPLPFLSVGTSSLISFLFSLGICFSD
ncbi:MAG TPA: FtsW/RodA/SpoVE family cell cycle protein, partial [Candidatus Woesebacteria bacterium]|nr:FtsW/RodA/SpoVE family cell cycle protein [Candidatus Woesebacteria bacterium]